MWYRQGNYMKDEQLSFEKIKKLGIVAINNKSNEIRIQHIVKKIISTGANVVGVYRLSMKLDSDNSRTSAIIKIINLLQEQGISVVVFDDRVKKVYIQFQVSGGFRT